MEMSKKILDWKVGVKNFSERWVEKTRAVGEKLPVWKIGVKNFEEKNNDETSKNSAVCVRTRTVNQNTFSTTSVICLEIEITVKDEISEGREIQA